MTIDRTKPSYRKGVLDYLDNNMDKIKEYRKTYYAKNKERLQEQQRQYRANAPKRIQKQETYKRFYQENKEALLQKSKEKYASNYIMCETCDKKVNKLRLPMHEATQLHQKHLQK